MSNQETTKVDPEYLSGFNLGYEAAKHLPEMVDQLVKAVGDTEKGKGFKHGMEQLAFEQTKEVFKARPKEQDKGVGKDRGRDLTPDH